jgi:hypothetical protein
MAAPPPHLRRDHRRLGISTPPRCLVDLNSSVPPVSVGEAVNSQYNDHQPSTATVAHSKGTRATQWTV